MTDNILKTHNAIKVILAIGVGVISWYAGNQTATPQDIITKIVKVTDSVIIHDTVQLPPKVVTKYIAGKNIVQKSICPPCKCPPVTKCPECPTKIDGYATIKSFDVNGHLVNVFINANNEIDTVDVLCPK